ncbi:unnamed protein product [Tuber melanosporum]|uniref:(Perigord truffle) hypothetical protein n=1 Tax=Tuber melanosporum (strain Mel28) TaxID=656061 RepID=D5GA62_TUBMM|nr:uncharacterized protein GSTUM_00005150001 [Tuber melanosporum]CAZ81416.1 unnamed protein product [Tuber melanosporum]
MHEQPAQHSNTRCQEHIAAFLRYCDASAKATCSRRQLFSSLNSKSTLAREISTITQDPPRVMSLVSWAQVVRKIAWEDGNNMNLPRAAGRLPFNYYFYILY